LGRPVGTFAVSNSTTLFRAKGLEASDPFRPFRAAQRGATTVAHRWGPGPLTPRWILERYRSHAPRRLARDAGRRPGAHGVPDQCHLAEPECVKEADDITYGARRSLARCGRRTTMSSRVGQDEVILRRQIGREAKPAQAGVRKAVQEQYRRTRAET